MRVREHHLGIPRRVIAKVLITNVIAGGALGINDLAEKK